MFPLASKEPATVRDLLDGWQVGMLTKEEVRSPSCFEKKKQLLLLLQYLQNEPQDLVSARSCLAHLDFKKTAANLITK
jgi:hypothetical protein